VDNGSRHHDDNGFLHFITDDIPVPMTPLYHLSHSIPYLFDASV
jgi:hypothetical protein